MDHVGFDLVHCAVYTILHVHIVCDYLCRCVSDNRKFDKVDCVDMRLDFYCTCSNSKEGPTDPGGCPPGRLLPTGLSEGHRSRSGSLGEDALQEPRLQH